MQRWVVLLCCFLVLHSKEVKSTFVLDNRNADISKGEWARLFTDLILNHMGAFFLVKCNFL